MKPKELVSSLISELNTRLSVPVHTAGIEQSRPMPAVLVDGISIDNTNYHNSNYAGSEWQGGSVVAEKYRQYFTARIDLEVRASDEIDAYEHLGELQNALSLIEIDPRVHIHNDVVRFTPGSSGQIRYQFNEPTETMLNQSVEIESFYETTHDDFETISSLKDYYDFN
jgi:hypothetical protein